MPIFDLYSKRRTELEKAGKEEVYGYDSPPATLRSQIKRIAKEALGEPITHRHYSDDSNNIYQQLHDIYCREAGVDFLHRGRDPYSDLMATVDSSECETFLDILELFCRAIDKVIRDYTPYERDERGITGDPDDLIQEINYRLRQAEFGYQYESGQIIRQDSKFTHDEVIRPALSLLTKPGYSGPQEEFLTAHRHYRAGEHEQAITEAAKSFESMMKAVCDKKEWAYPKGARATDLLKILRTHALLPDYLDSSFDQLASTLSSGLPKVRNDSGAHGQGSIQRNTPAYVASYALNLAAAKIVLLGEAAG